MRLVHMTDMLAWEMFTKLSFVTAAKTRAVIAPPEIEFCYSGEDAGGDCPPPPPLCIFDLGPRPRCLGFGVVCVHPALYCTVMLCCVYCGLYCA